MTTYNITINEQIPQGKALIALLKNMDAVMLKKVPPQKKEDSPYNSEFVAKIKRAMNNNDFRQIDADKIWESL